MKKSLIVFSLIATLLVGKFTNIVFAQTPPPINLTISPLVIELSGNPGETIGTKFSLINNGDQAIKLNIKPVLLDAHNDTDTYTTVDTYTPQDAPAWVTIENTNPTALPKEWLDIPYTVNIPTTAAFGHYFAFEISQADVDNTTVLQGAKIKGKILVVNLLTVRSPGLTASATITSFKTTSAVIEYLPVKFETIVSNSGNIHLKPRGNIFISNDRNKDIDILEVNESDSSILPNSTRTFESFWQNGFITRQTTTENGQTTSRLVFDWNKLTNFRLGRYTAKALLVYDDGTRDIPLTAMTSFWVIPYTALAIITLTTLILILVGVIIFRLILRKEVNRLRTKNA